VHTYLPTRYLPRQSRRQASPRERERHTRWRHTIPSPSPSPTLRHIRYRQTYLPRTPTASTRNVPILVSSSPNIRHTSSIGKPCFISEGQDADQVRSPVQVAVELDSRCFHGLAGCLFFATRLTSRMFACPCLWTWPTQEVPSLGAFVLPPRRMDQHACLRCGGAVVCSQAAKCDVVLVLGNRGYQRREQEELE